MWQMTFEEIYTTYSPGVFRLCRAYLNDEEQARDLVQETFISVWQHLEGFRGESSLRTWIFRIATNNCLRALERSKRMPSGELVKEPAAPQEEDVEEKVAFLYRCIGELEETDRILISLVLEDLPQDEIASITGLSYANTRVKIHRIKEKLAKKFSRHGGF
jgi:RNA polymerase sigma-70 factor (ECF subfamily)